MLNINAFTFTSSNGKLHEWHERARHNVSVCVLACTQKGLKIEIFSRSSFKLSIRFGVSKTKEAYGRCFLYSWFFAILSSGQKCGAIRKVNSLCLASWRNDSGQTNWIWNAWHCAKVQTNGSRYLHIIVKVQPVGDDLNIASHSRPSNTRASYLSLKILLK